MSALELEGRLLLDGELVAGRLRAAEGRIVEIAALAGRGARVEGPVVAPGLVDLHVHGFGGHDPLDDLDGMARALARAGTTAFCPTLFPQPADELRGDLGRVRAGSGSLAGALVLGAHLEGPFLNPDACGALPAEHFAEPSPAALRSIVGSGEGVATMTVAPELTGARELLAELVRCGIRPSLGHSLATAGEARRAAADGAVGATHLFNAMRPWHHREVGLAGFALTEDALHAELIGDGVHVSPQAIELALLARGPSGLCLVSDALPGAGTGCDAFHFRGQRHFVRRGAAYCAGPASQVAEEGGQPRLAGSASSQLEMVQGLVRGGVLGLAEALAMASETPARALGREDLGRLTEGARADLVVLEPGDLRLREAYVGGRPMLAPGAASRRS